MHIAIGTAPYCSSDRTHHWTDAFDSSGENKSYKSCENKGYESSRMIAVFRFYLLGKVP